jgi:uncharacterized membrane protein
VPDILRVLLSRILAPWIALAAAWISAKFGIVFTEDQVKALVDIVILLTFAGVIKQGIDARVNKSDVASPKVAGANKDAGV